MLRFAFIQILLSVLFIPMRADNRLDFFENRIRPVLVENCYECHNSIKQAKSGLVLDYKGGLLKGGNRGSVVSLENPKESLILKAMGHLIRSLKMPKGGPKLSPEVIKDFEKWISEGAYDPRENPPSAEEFAQETSWEKTREKRKSWWSFQPIRKIAPPSSHAQSKSHPVDQFLVKKLQKSGLKPNDDADGITILRRLTFATTGLPPTIEQQDRFQHLMDNGTAHAVEVFTDELLASPHFGERWARHWMDWLRYADSHGSEGDPPIPNAYRYRNYLIRALNADVGYDQLVLEHFAGDLLPEPRINKQLGLNESVIGTSNLRFVLHGFAPTDALDEHVRFTDDQIDAVTKTFLALTVSCARCHHHKFDAISQDDYYALFGILSNGRPAQKVIEDPTTSNEDEEKLRKIKSTIKSNLSAVWKSIDIASKMVAGTRKESHDHVHNFLMPWQKLRHLDDKNFPREWDKLEKQVRESETRLASRFSTKYPYSWKLKNDTTYKAWTKSGTGLGELPSKPGAYTIALEGNQILRNILPAGAYTHLLSSRQNGTLSSPRFVFEKGDLWVRVIGDKGSVVRYSVWNYPRKGTVYKRSSPDPLTEKWIKFNADYWAGETGYLEVTTNRDHPVEAGNSERSWFGVTEAILGSVGQTQPCDEIAEVLSPLFVKSLAQKTREGLLTRYTEVIQNSVLAWEADDMTDNQARILNDLLKENFLPNTEEELVHCRELVTTYRRMEEKIIAPRLAPGVLDGEPFDQALFERGNHKKPLHKVPRRFLEAIDDTPYPKDSIGRLEFAKDLLRDDNPFTTRVIVNRVWHHLFGKGLVRTTDNFGKLGELPSHPELLDYLSQKFREEQWSIKGMIRFLVNSEAFRASSNPSPKAIEIDPQNLLLSHANLRRLEAEAIRDAMLLASGRLQLSRVAEGKSEPANSSRRAVYRQIKRNSLDPFLSVFDAPVPSSTKGRRDITNVPAQSLTLMNDPDVLRNARGFANLHKTGGPKDIISKMFRKALGRHPIQNELAQSLAYLNSTDQEAAKLKVRITQTTDKLKVLDKQIDDILNPIRKQLLALHKTRGKNQELHSNQPLLLWDFELGLVDSVNGIKCNLKNGAFVEKGRLILRQGGYAVTEKIPFKLPSKTLAAWVRLDNLQQRGGGVMSVQTPNGMIFDSIVFAEKEERKWISGSNGFRRTQAFFSAPIESQADQDFVHLAITYGIDGIITGYRNGIPYGKPYFTSTHSFREDDYVVSFGVRHLPANPQRLLVGQIDEASIFDYALSTDEVKSIYDPDSYLSSKDVEAKIPHHLKDSFSNLAKEKNSLQMEINQIQESLEAADKPELEDLALALFNMKEFIYLK